MQGRLKREFLQIATGSTSLWFESRRMARANARLDANENTIAFATYLGLMTTMPWAYFRLSVSSAERGLSSEVWPGPLLLVFGENKLETAWEQRRLFITYPRVSFIF